MYTLGSLFDGSGGFPLAGALCGIEPLWASEVEPYPIAVTRSRFPGMAHYGDISKMHGGDIPPVDVITFGSPCQDVSCAGRRRGMKHKNKGDAETTRSGLFFDAVRIMSEMRDATDGKYPKFALFENVPGIFSSNSGEAFRTVLEAFIQIIEANATMPPPPKNGWPYADVYVGSGWSLAYRTFAAQFWGVPQRRRRLHLVFDFTGERAFEILFKRPGLRGHITESREAGQRIAGATANCAGADNSEGKTINSYSASGGDLSSCLCAAYGTKWNGNSGAYSGENFVIEEHTDENCLTPWEAQGNRVVGPNGVAPSLRGGGEGNHGYPDYNVCVPCPAVPIAFAQNQRNEIRDLHNIAGALAANPGIKQQTLIAIPYVSLPSIYENENSNIQFPKETNSTEAPYDADNLPIGIDGYNGEITGDKAATLGVNCGMSTGRNGVLCPQPEIILDDQGGQQMQVRVDGQAPTLRAEAHGNVPCVMQAAGFLPSASPTAGSVGYEDETAPTLRAGLHSGVCVAYDARGNGNGSTTNTITGDHENRITDYTTVVCMATGQANAEICKDKAPCLICSHEHPVLVHPQITGTLCGSGAGLSRPAGIGSETDLCVATAAVDCRNLRETPEMSGTLQAKSTGGYSLNYLNPIRCRYIVRRLTPLECCRLQNFPDYWGETDRKEDFSDEEYRFWVDVRNTHAAINGKATKDYTKKQMLSWYNKLHTDSAEYRMWGNGIALPPALYCMQGIADALEAMSTEGSQVSGGKSYE